MERMLVLDARRVLERLALPRKRKQLQRLKDGW